MFPHRKWLAAVVEFGARRLEAVVDVARDAQQAVFVRLQSSIRRDEGRVAVVRRRVLVRRVLTAKRPAKNGCVGKINAVIR